MVHPQPPKGMHVPWLTFLLRQAESHGILTDRLCPSPQGAAPGSTVTEESLKVSEALGEGIRGQTPTGQFILPSSLGPCGTEPWWPFCSPKLRFLSIPIFLLTKHGNLDATRTKAMPQSHWPLRGAHACPQQSCTVVRSWFLPVSRGLVGGLTC